MKKVRAQTLRIARLSSVHRGLWAKAILCMILLALATAGISFLMGPAIKFVMNGADEGMGTMLGRFPVFAHLSRETAFWLLPLMLLGLALVKGLSYFGQFLFMGTLTQRVAAELRSRLTASVLAQAPSWFSQARTGDLLFRYGTDVQRMSEVVQFSLASFVRDSLQVLFQLGLCFYLDWKLSLVAFAGVPLVVWPITRLAKKLKRRSTESFSAQGRLTSIVQEGLWGVRVIQAYRMEGRELTRFDEESARVVRAETKAAKSKSLSAMLLEIAITAGVAGVLILILRSGGVTEQHISFLVAIAWLSQPARDLGRAPNWLIPAEASGERVFEVIDHPPAIGVESDAIALPRFADRLVFEGVDYAYGERLALEGLDLTLRKGESLALVGESGAGKSTAALLAMRFADPSRGRVLLDGVPLKDATLESVRGQFGLVTQDPYLLSGTIAENIALGRPEATVDQIREAARVANASEFIEAMPEGYATEIGERGVRLSGGQKQRIALARALLIDAPILLLDEATSNLDPQSEREVAQALERAMAGRTSLVIAHRLSTIRNADRIVVLRQGKVIEEGRHETLLTRGGEYARLYQREAALEAASQS